MGTSCFCYDMAASAGGIASAMPCAARTFSPFDFWLELFAGRGRMAAR